MGRYRGRPQFPHLPILPASHGKVTEEHLYEPAEGAQGDRDVTVGPVTFQAYQSSE